MTPPRSDPSAAPAALVHVLPGGARLLMLPLPWAQTVAVSVFIRTGSAHETAAQSGISHVVEHMAFKGTATRDCRRINLDAELLGAEFNAHTDKDHTAYHLRGQPAHAQRFIEMLGDIVCASSFPEDELERERQVILQEVTEDEDDPVSTAFKLFDAACWGLHALARPVIGRRACIEAFGRADLLAYVGRQVSAANVVIAVAGPLQGQDLLRATERAFAALPAGSDNLVPGPVYGGGLKTRAQAGSSQSHLVLGYPLPRLGEADSLAQLTAMLLGEGMSSPLLHELRERRGLVYYAACSADLGPHAGQLVIEASTTPEHLHELSVELVNLLQRQLQQLDELDLSRARHQLAVRRLRTLERPYRRLEAAAIDLLHLGRVRPPEEVAAADAAVPAEAVRELLLGLMRQPAALAVAGKLPRGSKAGLAEQHARLQDMVA